MQSAGLRRDFSLSCGMSEVQIPDFLEEVGNLAFTPIPIPHLYHSASPISVKAAQSRGLG
jgi:hypothetical protein